MTATAKNYSTSTIEIGPADIWLNVAVPGAGGMITLASDGTPEAVANPSCVHLGMTQEGSKCVYTPNLQTFESDELTAPILTQNIGEVLSIEGTMLQVLDTSILSYLIAGGTRTTGSGYEKISIGGKQVISTFTICVIAPVQADTTKFVVYNIYKGYNSAGFNFDLSRKKIAAIPFKFEAQSISTRAAGDQAGAIWKSIP